MRLIYLSLLIVLFNNCERDFGEVTLVPQYFDPLDFSEIQTLAPQPIVNQGTIVFIDKFLFVNDKNRGIHVIDNSIAGNPNYIYFWNIPGNSTFTIEDDYLFADNGPHMLVINISNFGNIKYERYIKGVFYENMREQFPEIAESGQPFLCPDPEKGRVKSWRQELIQNPNCQRI